MTIDTGHRTVDGAVVSATEAAQLAAEEARFAERRRQAARVVAGASQGTADCQLLLDVLGLDAEIVRAARSGSRRRGRGRGRVGAA